MDLGKLLTAIANRFLRKAVTKGVAAGIDHVARRGKVPEAMTPADRDQARKARDLAKRARQAAKLTRRLGR